MLNQFFADWNTAMQSRTIISELKSRSGVILNQETEFTFRDTKIVMYSKLVAGGENLPANKRKWDNGLYVPSTKKVIPATTHKSRTKCAVAILLALTPGYEHEDRIALRKQNREKRIADNYKNQHKQALAGTTFTTDEINLIVDWVENNAVNNHYSWGGIIIDAMKKHHQLITGRELSSIGIELGYDEKLHTTRMFNTVADMVTRTFKDKFGIPIIFRDALDRNFRYPKENIKYAIYVVRNAFCKLYAEIDSPAKFTYLVNLLSKYYEYLFDTTVADRKDELKVRREKMTDRKVKQQINGKTTKPSRVFESKPVPVENSIGNMFGDVLDALATAEVSYDPQDKPRHPKRKNFSVATDGQINGKQAEQPAKTEEEVVAVDTTEETIEEEINTIGIMSDAVDDVVEEHTETTSTEEDTEQTDTIINLKAEDLFSDSLIVLSADIHDMIGEVSTVDTELSLSVDTTEYYDDSDDATFMEAAKAKRNKRLTKRKSYE